MAPTVDVQHDAVSVERRVEVVPHRHRPDQLAEGAPASGSAAAGTSSSRRCTTSTLDDRAGRDRRHPRPQRLGQVDAAQVHRRDPHARRRGRCASAAAWPRCSSSAPASTPSSPGARTCTSTPRSTGWAASDIDRVFDDIVDFAELAQFIDEPVKHYSSGMYVRLGFAVAVNLDPDVLLVDEVLAVGDELFQAKCLSRIKQFQAEGRTIVFVTHDAATVRQVCDRAIVLDHGQLVLDGDPGRRHPQCSASTSTATLAERTPLGERRHRADRPRRDRAPRARARPHATSSPASRSTIVVELSPDAADRRPGARHRDQRPARQPACTTSTPTASARRSRHSTSHGRSASRIGRTWLLDGEFPVSLKLTDRGSGQRPRLARRRRLVPDRLGRARRGDDPARRGGRRTGGGWGVTARRESAVEVSAAAVRQCRSPT